MLVLSRRKQESIVIGGNIVVTVLDVQGGKVRLGIEAPQEVAIHREEIARAINEWDDPSGEVACCEASE